MGRTGSEKAGIDGIAQDNDEDMEALLNGVDCNENSFSIAKTVAETAGPPHLTMIHREKFLLTILSTEKFLWIRKEKRSCVLQKQSEKVL